MPNPEDEELTAEQLELLAKAAKAADEEVEQEFGGFTTNCEVDDDAPCGPRVKVNGILVCPTCDFVKVTDGKANANPPKKKD